MEKDLNEIYTSFKTRQNLQTKADKKKKAGKLGLEEEEEQPVRRSFTFSSHLNEMMPLILFHLFLCHLNISQEEDGDDTAAIASMKAAAPAKEKKPAAAKNPLIIEMPEGTAESETLRAKRYVSPDYSLNHV
jgi:hypothetical protein